MEAQIIDLEFARSPERTIKHELGQAYRAIGEYGFAQDRITKLLLLDWPDKCEPSRAISICEREFPGSESYAMFLYKQSLDELGQNGVAKETVDGELFTGEIEDLFFTGKPYSKVLERIVEITETTLVNRSERNIA